MKKCVNCGCTELYLDQEHEVAICTACGTEMPLILTSTEGYERANELLSEKLFKEAIDAYDQILLKNPKDAAICWYRALAEYGIEYVRDPNTDELIPTLHRLSTKVFSEYFYVKEAIKYAPSSDRKSWYQEQSRKIDQIQRKSLTIAREEEPYDVFICYKRTDENETRTQDSRLASDIYRELNRRYKVFFAEETLKAGEEYEPHIWRALNTARVMLAIATKPEFYEAPWVKNEWSRYLELMNQETDSERHRELIPVFLHMELKDLPADLRQGFRYIDWDNLPNPKKQLLHEAASLLGKRVVQPEPIGPGIGITRPTSEKKSMEVTPKNLNVRGHIFLTDEDFTSAKHMFERAISLDPYYAPSYFGMALCELQIPGESAIELSGKELGSSAYFKKALSLADEDTAEHYMELSRASVEWKKHYNDRKLAESEYRKQLDKILYQIKMGEFEASGFERFKTVGNKLLVAQEFSEKNERTTRKGKKKLTKKPGKAQGIIMLCFAMLTAELWPITLLIAIVVWLVVRYGIHGKWWKQYKHLKNLRKDKDGKRRELLMIRDAMEEDVKQKISALYEKYQKDFLDCKNAENEKDDALESAKTVIRQGSDSVLTVLDQICS